MNEEDIRKFFEEIGLVKGLENMKKFQEEFIDKYYIEKQRVKEIILRLEEEGCQTGSGFSSYKLKKELGVE